MLGAQMIGFSRVSRLSRVRVSVRIKVRFGFSGANMNRKKTLGGELQQYSAERKLRRQEPCIYVGNCLVSSVNLLAA